MTTRVRVRRMTTDLNIVAAPTASDGDELQPLISLLELLVQGAVDGDVPFRQEVRISNHLGFSGFRWRRLHGAGDSEYLILILDLKRTPFGGLGGISYQPSDPGISVSILLTELLKQARQLRVCEDCCGTYSQQQLSQGLCCGCHLARNLVPTKQACAICQEDARRYYTTSCGHHFHYGCLSTVLEQLYRDRRLLPSFLDPSERLPMKCPTCRRIINSEFDNYLLAEEL